MLKKSHFIYFVELIAVCLVYFICGKIGLNLQAVNKFAALFWLPTGISLASILIFGYRLWPAIFLGAFFVNFTNGAPSFVAFGTAIGNTLEALVSAYILNQFIGFRHTLERTIDVVGLTLIAAPIGALISASIGVTSLWLGAVIKPTDLFNTGVIWFLGDLLSDFIVAPFILVWSTALNIKSINIKRIFEGVLVSILTIFCVLFIFTDIFGLKPRNIPVTYTIFPPIIWIALRFGSKATATTIFIASLFEVWSVAVGRISFRDMPPFEGLFYFQSFMGVVAVTSMILAAVGAERRYLEKRKDDFIITASHELKTPITSIKAFTQLLRKIFKQKDEKQAVTFLTSMDKQLDKLTFLINDLLDLSKIQSDQFVLKKEPFSLYEVLKESAESMQATTKRHKISVKGRVARNVIGDRDRIGQVLNNLFSNAIKYSPHSKEINALISSDSRNIKVGIQDFGIGIPRSMQHQVFERFFRVQDKGTSDISGVGLGLYISSEIIKQHGGRIWVESAVSKGSTFYFTLPIPRTRIRRRISIAVISKRLKINKEKSN